MACCNCRLGVLLSLLFFAQALNAQRLPEWELGLALGFATLPYYRGADAGRNMILPLPLAVVRGEKSKAKSKVQVNLLGSRRVNLGLSLAAMLPVPAGQAVAIRFGMPSLDATFEFGPRINAQLWRHARHRFFAVLPVRFVSSVSFSRLAYQGWRVSPYLLYEYQFKGRHPWRLDILVGPLFAASAYNDYYYSVESAYVTEKRTYFNAKQGYSGSRITVYTQKSLGRLWLSAFARYDVLAGAAFEKSPLVAKKATLFGGFVLGWVFKKSPSSVYLPD